MPNNGRPAVGGFAQPVGRALAPVTTLGDHRRRTGDDDAGVALSPRQCIAALDVRHHRVLALESGGDADPVREVAMATHRGDGLAGFEDQEWLFHNRALNAEKP
jgi:hypothetical protein